MCPISLHSVKSDYTDTPLSLLNVFKYKEFDSYWFETSTLTYLVELLKKHYYVLGRMAHEEWYDGKGLHQTIHVTFRNGWTESIQDRD